MRLQPIVYTTDLEAAVDWYGRVLGTAPNYRSAVWTTFGVGSGSLAIHRVDAAPEGSKVALSLIATEPLEEVLARVEPFDVVVERGIQDETFGRSIVLRDPDGLAIQVNEHAGHE